MPRQQIHTEDEAIARKNIDYLLSVSGGWPNLKDILNNKIGQMSLLHVGRFTYKGDLERMISGEIGKKKGTPFWWKELKVVTSEVMDELHNNKPPKRSIKEQIRPSGAIMKSFTYNYFLNQDSILTRHFEYYYKQVLPNIKFVPIT
jgi:hypothetical protein